MREIRKRRTFGPVFVVVTHPKPPIGARQLYMSRVPASAVVAVPAARGASGGQFGCYTWLPKIHMAHPGCRLCLHVVMVPVVAVHRRIIVVAENSEPFGLPLLRVQVNINNMRPKK